MGDIVIKMEYESVLHSTEYMFSKVNMDRESVMHARGFMNIDMERKHLFGFMDGNDIVVRVLNFISRAYREKFHCPFNNMNRNNKTKNKNIMLIYTLC